MNKRRFQHTAFFTVALLFLLVGVCVLWLHAQQRQYALNRQLIAALVQGDDKRALALVKAGADPNTCYTPMPAPSVPELVKQFIHRLSPTVNNGPTALLLACGAPWDDVTFYEVQKHRPDAPQLVKAMLQHHAKVNVQDQDKWTPLQWAVHRQRWGTATVLLQFGADANTKAKDGLTPLMYAAPSLDVVRLLLEHGADVNAKDWNGWTPLIAATQFYASPDVVRMLLAYGADVNAEDNRGITPLIEATGDSDHAPDTVRLLLEHGARVNLGRGGRFTPLTSAAEYLAPGAVRLLLEHGAKVNAKDADGWTALHRAVNYAILPGTREGRPYTAVQDITRQLLAHGATPNVEDKDGVTPLMMAQRAGRSDLVALMWPAGGSAQRHAQQSQHALDRELIAALLRYDTKYALVLVKQGADSNTRYEPANKCPTAFAIACGAHWIDEDAGKLHTHFSVPECVPLVQAMITRGANVNDKEWEGKTPLSWASWHRWDTVKLLQEHGAR